jgi:hypothetical protein
MDERQAYWAKRLQEASDALTEAELAQRRALRAVHLAMGAAEPQAYRLEDVLSVPVSGIMAAYAGVAEQTREQFLETANPSKPTPVRVDSLKVGAKCWVEAEVVERDVANSLMWVKPTDAAGGIYIDDSALVLPSEPSPTVASEAGVRLGTLQPGDSFLDADGGEWRLVKVSERNPNQFIVGNGKGSVQSWGPETVVYPRAVAAPPPLVVQVGRRYRRRDGVEVECVAPGENFDGKKQFVFSPDALGCEQRYPEDGRHLKRGDHSFDIIEDLGPVASEPLRLKVGERYERRDGMLTDCVGRTDEDDAEDSSVEFKCVAVNGSSTAYYANGKWLDQDHPFDIVRHVGPTPVTQPAPDWLTDEMVELLRSAGFGVAVYPLRPELTDVSMVKYEQLARALSKRLAPHLDDERKALLAEVGR